MVVVAGIDVSKATLEVSISEGPVLSPKNSAAGIRRLLRHLERAGMTKAVCESTGGYERPVVGKLREAELSVQVAHPLRVRSFARACGYEAKTAPLDAQVLSRHSAVFSESDTGRKQLMDDRARELQAKGQAAVRSADINSGRNTNGRMKVAQI